MKKWLLSLAVITALTACSSPESRRVANDSYSKNDNSTPSFSMLDTAGLTIVGQENTYKLPTNDIQKSEAIDIRPPSNPMAIIGNSVTHFDGEHASIVYPASKRTVYNLQQIQRLLTEKNISFTTKDNKIQTDWTNTGRTDEAENTQVRYVIEETGNQNANALTVSVLEMKRDGIVALPNQKEKQLYAADRLNQLVGELNKAYKTQQEQTAPNAAAAAGTIHAQIGQDMNRHLALALSSDFSQSWEKLGAVLPALGFEIKEETFGRGHRLLKYKALDEAEWARFGTTQPQLDNGEYHMQLSAYRNQSAVVIYDKDKQALTGDNAQALYQALMNLMTK